MQGLLSNLFIRWLAEPTDEHGRKAIKIGKQLGVWKRAGFRQQRAAGSTVGLAL